MVAYQDGHRILSDGEVAFEGELITYVGPAYPGQADERIDATSCLICPGFINTHVHANTMALHRLNSDIGRAGLFGAGWLETLVPRRGSKLNTGEPLELAARYTAAELLSYGTTTFVEAGGHAALLEALASGTLGLRMYAGPPIRSSEYYIDERGLPVREPVQDNGLEAALAFVGRGLCQPILTPRELEACDERTLREVRAAASANGLRINMHACQNISELDGLRRLYGCTPIEYLDQIGFLGPDVILGHCIFIDHQGRDLEILGDRHVNVAHCPLGTGRRGFTLDSFDRYRAAGVNVGLGTDAYPRDIVAEMRCAGLLAKSKDGLPVSGSAAAVFEAATLGGANALGREDLGRIAPGAKADLVFIDFDDPRFGPVWDPIKTLVDCASGDNVRTVIIDGQVRMRDRVIPGVDRQALLRAARSAAQDAWGRIQEWDYRERTAQQISPPSFPAWR